VLSYFHIVTTYIKHGQRSLTEQSTSFLMSPLYSASLLSDAYVRNEAHLARPLFFPMSIFMPSVLRARTNLLECCTDKCARGPAGFKLSSFPAGETHMCIMFYKTPFDFTYKVKVRTDKQSVIRSQNSKYFAGEIFARAFEDRDATAQLILFEINMYRIRI
jgi:hypothetical protein